MDLRRAFPCVLLLAACGAEVTSGPGLPLSIVQAPTNSGDNQTMIAGHILQNPLRAQVLRDRAPVAGVEVLWTNQGDSLWFAPWRTITDGNGIASTQWRLRSQVGQQTAAATVADGSGASVTFVATAVPTFPFQILGTRGDGQTGQVGTELGRTLQVIVGDEFANPASGTEVQWQGVSGDATVSPAVSYSGTDGVAQTAVTLGQTPGTITIEAQVIGLTVTFSATATP